MSDKEKQEKALEKIEDQVPGAADLIPAGFGTVAGFGLMLKQAKWLSTSTLVPEQFRGNVPNTVIALEIAQRMGASPLAVMQNLYIVHGKPGWSAQFIIAAINSTGKFSPLRFEITGAGDGRSCVAWSVEKATGEKLVGPAVSIEMAKKEGWSARNGSKWQTMSDVMLRYRAATFFGRLYAPEILMGMSTTDEIVEVHDSDFKVIREDEANQGPVIEPPAAPLEAPAEKRAYRRKEVAEFKPPSTGPEPQAEFKLEPSPADSIRPKQDPSGPGF